jgi:hypothetical protein
MGINFGELSGWILPDGTWLPVAEWWHINAIYDLRDSCLALANNSAVLDALSSGDEAEIRHQLALAGFAKVSRGILDTYSLSDLQLKTLQDQILYFDSTQEIVVLRQGGSEKKTTLERVLKLKRAHPLLAIEGSHHESPAPELIVSRSPPKSRGSDLNLCADKESVQLVRRAKP